MKDKFIEIYKNNIKREGADNLLDWLEKSDFFKAPASTKYHLSVEGGLCTHSLNVYNRLHRIVFSEEVNLSGNDIESLEESVAICALLHDLCKVNFYKPEWKNVKVYAPKGSKSDEGGRFDWQTVQGYSVDDQLPYGHGEKSVYIISGFMKLSREESMAIRWHIGGFDDSVKGGSYALNGAFEKYPLALRLHIADLEAAYLDEKEEPKV